MFERQIGGPTLVISVNDHVMRFGPGPPAAPDQFAGGDALPQVAEQGPSCNTMKVSEDVYPRKRGKVLPVPLGHFTHQARDPEAPLSEVDCRGAAGIQHGPLPGARLSRRNPLAPACVRANDDLRSKSIRRRDFFALGFGAIHSEHCLSAFLTPFYAGWPGRYNLPLCTL